MSVCLLGEILSGMNCCIFGGIVCLSLVCIHGATYALVLTLGLFNELVFVA